MKKPMKTLDRHLLQRYWRVASPYWRQEEKWKAWGMIALLVILLLAQTRLAVLLNEKTGEFTSALAAHNEDRFWDAIKISLGLLVIAVPIHAFFYYVRDKLGIRWRRWLTNRFLNKYFAKRHFYDLNSSSTIDNPDQRIAEDIRTFTQRSLFFLLILIGSIPKKLRADRLRKGSLFLIKQKLNFTWMKKEILQAFISKHNRTRINSLKILCY